MKLAPPLRTAEEDWVPLAEHARERGVAERTLRRQLTALHARLGGGVLRSYNQEGTKVRKWFFNRATTKAGLERDPDAIAVQVGELTLQFEDLKEKVNALRQAHNSLKRLVKVPKATDHT